MMSLLELLIALDDAGIQSIYRIDSSQLQLIFYQGIEEVRLTQPVQRALANYKARLIKLVSPLPQELKENLKGT